MFIKEDPLNRGGKWVLQVFHSYYSPFPDCARQYAALFRNSGHRVTTVYLCGPPDMDVERDSASDEVIFLGYSSKDIRGLKIRALRDLYRLTKRSTYAFCVAHRFKPVYIALLASRLPVIGVHHSFSLYKNWNRRFVVNRFRDRLLLIGVSNAVRDEIRKSLPDWPEHRIERLYNRIDANSVKAEQLSREQARRVLGLPPQAWVVGNVARLHPDKDQMTLIKGFAEALPHLPVDSMLLIAGEGKLQHSLELLTQELGIDDRVRFAGFVPDARRYFKAFDVFALSSNREPFGMVLLEAIAAKLPIICSDCGGGPEVVQNTGWLFPFADHHALANCLISSANMSEDERESRAQAAEVTLKTLFSDEAAVERFSEIIEQSRLLTDKAY